MACVETRSLIDRLEACAMALHIGKTVRRLAACSSANRPASRNALLNFVGRTQTWKAYVINAHEVARFLLEEGLKNQEALQEAKDLLQACSLDPTESVQLQQHSEAKRRILRAAKQGSILETSLRSLVAWILSQSYVWVSVSNAAFFEMLVADGYVQESADGSLAYNLSLEPIAVDAHLFTERRVVPQIEKKKLPPKDVFEMQVALEDSPRISSVPAVESFEDFALDEALIRSLRWHGMQDPSEVQQFCLQPLLSGQDVLAQARSGTGKTVAQVLAALNVVKKDECHGGRQEPRCPTGHYFKKVFDRKKCRVWNGCKCAGCVTAKAPVASHDVSSSLLKDCCESECAACGCSAEVDAYGDRICWCDSCPAGCIGSIPVRKECSDNDAFEADDEFGNSADEDWEATEQGVYCRKCSWFLCQGCYEREGSSLMRQISTPKCQALFIVPTRELALQIQRKVKGLGWGLGLRCHACVGGTSVRGDIDMLRNGQHIVVGNPGRLYDMISKRHLRVDDVKLLVMDEGDALLSQNLKDRVYDIFKCVPPNVQVAFFSTIITPETLDTTSKFMQNPASILSPDHMLVPALVRHFYMVGGEEKVTRLLGIWGLISRAPGVIVFCNTRRAVDYLAENVMQAGLQACTLHAELDQKERDLVLREFRKRSCKVLFCTNEFGRGLDVPHVRLVVNFDMPSNAADYLLRSGRCGRFGRSGVVLTLATKQEIPAMRAIANHYHMQVNETGMETLHESLGKCLPKKDV